MNEAIIIWLYLSAESILGWVVFYLYVAGLCIFLAAVFKGATHATFCDDDYDRREREKGDNIFNSVIKYANPKIIITLILFTALFPDRGDLKYIIGGAVAWNGIEYAKDIEGVEKLPENVVNAMNHFLEDIADKEAK